MRHTAGFVYVCTLRRGRSRSCDGRVLAGYPRPPYDRNETYSIEHVTKGKVNDYNGNDAIL